MSEYALVSVSEVAEILDRLHYLGAIKRGFAFAQFAGDKIVACMCWAKPTSRHLPQDGTWLELSRWCLTPEAGYCAGSRMHKQFVRACKREHPEVAMLVSYSDPSVGHTGALYRACNWKWAPTWHRLRPPPTKNGNWGNGRIQAVKDRWVFQIKPDPRSGQLLLVRDSALNPGLKEWSWA